MGLVDSFSTSKEECGKSIRGRSGVGQKPCGGRAGDGLHIDESISSRFGYKELQELSPALYSQRLGALVRAPGHHDVTVLRALGPCNGVVSDLHHVVLRTGPEVRGLRLVADRYDSAALDAQAQAGSRAVELDAHFLYQGARAPTVAELE